jgi:hypothetical protein
MWRLYCSDDGVRGRGVALQTTLEKLEASVLDQFFHKRMGFAHENEVRLVKASAEHSDRLIAPDPRTGYVPEPSPGGMPDHPPLDD